MKTIYQHQFSMKPTLCSLLVAISFASVRMVNAENAHLLINQTLTASNPISEGLQMTAVVISNQPNPQVGDALFLDLAVKNVLNRRIGLSVRGTVFNDYHVEMEDAHGKPVPLTAYGKLTQDKHKFGFYTMNKMVPIEAGQTKHLYVWLNRIYDLSLEGRYTIHAKYDAARLDGKGSSPLLTNDVSVTIVPTSDADIIATVIKK